MKKKLFCAVFIFFAACFTSVTAEDACQFDILSSIASETRESAIDEGIHHIGNIASLFDENNILRLAKKAASIKMHANQASIIVNGGYTFHIADYYGYYGNSRIVTCMDGMMRGHQGIADNGILRIESTNVEWYKNHFIHYYPAGKVTSYTNSQTAEFY